VLSSSRSPVKWVRPGHRHELAVQRQLQALTLTLRHNPRYLTGEAVTAASVVEWVNWLDDQTSAPLTLKNPKAIEFGGSLGLDGASARRLVPEAADVTIAGRPSACAGHRARRRATRIDVTDPASVEEAVADLVSGTSTKLVGHERFDAREPL
jgi:hypothetical protein